MIVYLVCYAASLLLALQPPLSFIRRRASGGGGVSVCVRLYPEWKSSASAGEFSALSFVGGQGLACMKLSYLSQAWSAGTWLGLLAAFAGFYLAFYYLEAFSGEASVRVGGHSGAVQRRGLESYAGTCFFLRGGAGGGIGRLLRDRGGLYGLYSAAAPWSSACLFLFPCDRASLSDGVLCAGSGALCDLFLHRGRSQPGDGWCVCFWQMQRRWRFRFCACRAPSFCLRYCWH